MSTEQKKPKRNFVIISRMFKLVFALMIVFFLSFFITITIKTSHPIDFIISEYFDDTPTDQIIDNYAN